MNRIRNAIARLFAGPHRKRRIDAIVKRWR